LEVKEMRGAMGVKTLKTNCAQKGAYSVIFGVFGRFLFGMRFLEDWQLLDRICPEGAGG
jgi:lipid-A-disaccharide synthase-like uncharacterized protein